MQFSMYIIVLSMTADILDFEVFRQSGFFSVGLGLLFSGLGL